MDRLISEAYKIKNEQEAIRELEIMRKCFKSFSVQYQVLSMAIEALAIPSAELCDFAKWVANEIFDDMWEYNKDSFAEIACRKLEKLGIVRAKGDEWKLIEPPEGRDKE